MNLRKVNIVKNTIVFDYMDDFSKFVFFAAIFLGMLTGIMGSFLVTIYFRWRDGSKITSSDIIGAFLVIITYLVLFVLSAIY